VIRRSWRTQLKASTTQEAVLTVVSQFLEEWSPGEIAALPREARPGRLLSKSDVVRHALDLGRIHADYAGTPGHLAGLQEMLLFFTHASVRIAHLAAVAQLNTPSTASPGMKPVADEEG
jgi:hypothetical protein